MRLPSLLLLLLFPLFVLSQTTSNRSSSAAVSTISSSSGASSSVSASGNSTQSGNQTQSAGSSSSATANVSTTPYSLLPTAPTSIDGGGGTNGAPVPGQSDPGGIYGPNDGYISGVLMVHVNAILVSLVGVVVGGFLVLS